MADKLVVALVVLALGVVGTIALVVVIEAQEAEQWGKFSKANHCHVVSVTSGSTIIAGNGQIGFVPGHTGWLCNDGVTYNRSN